MMEWTQPECEAIVTDYLAMLDCDLRGEPYTKAAHRRRLQPQLKGRSKSAIEYKHQNISAILIEIGYPYISGYKPASNYQQRLRNTVLSRLDQIAIPQIADALIAQTPAIAPLPDWEHVITAPPEIEHTSPGTAVREFTPGQYNFTQREQQNRQLGLAGEAFVLELEQQRLRLAGRADLAGEVEWTSRDRGDGAGYDIRSFNVENETECFIEVKTTKLGKYLPFYISDNEVAFSQQHPQHYALYRLYEFRSAPRLFMLEGDISERMHLRATQYRAGFR